MVKWFPIHKPCCNVSTTGAKQAAGPNITKTLKPYLRNQQRKRMWRNIELEQMLFIDNQRNKALRRNNDVETNQPIYFVWKLYWPLFVITDCHIFSILWSLMFAYHQRWQHTQIYFFPWSSGTLVRVMNKIKL